MPWIKDANGGYLNADKIINIYPIVCMPKFGMRGTIQIYAKTQGRSTNAEGQVVSDTPVIYTGDLSYLDSLLEKILAELEAKLREFSRDPATMNAEEALKLREKIQEMKYKGLYALEAEEFHLVECDMHKEGDRMIEHMIKTIESARKFHDPAIIDFHRVFSRK